MLESDRCLCVLVCAMIAAGRSFLLLLLLTSPSAIRALTPSGQADQPSYDIAFVSKRETGAGIYVMRGDGSGTTLVRAEPNALLMMSSWSPDGKRIAYVAFGPEDEALLTKYRLPTHFPLYVMNADGTGRERVLEVPVSPFFRWSPDGRYLAFSSGYEDPSWGNPGLRGQAGKVAIYLLDLKSLKTSRLTPLGESYFFSWSPDGQHIAFTSNLESQINDIYVIDADGKNLRRLTTAQTNDTQPEWSPRGDSIAYVAAPMPGQPRTESGVFVMKPDGSERRRVSTALASHAGWSPDGIHLQIAASPSALVNVATGAGIELPPALDRTFSPDGAHLLHRVSDPATKGAWSIQAIDLRGENVRTLASFATTFAVSPILRRKP